MALLTPFRLSKVRRISSSRAWVSTWMVTSSGMRPDSMRKRVKSKSVCEAEGKPTSISLKPMATSASNMRSLRSCAHRLDQRLVAVAQVDGTPDRRLGDRLRRPLSIRQVDRRPGPILDGIVGCAVARGGSASRCCNVHGSGSSSAVAGMAGVEPSRSIDPLSAQAMPGRPSGAAKEAAKKKIGREHERRSGRGGRPARTLGRCGVVRHGSVLSSRREPAKWLHRTRPRVVHSA